MFAGHSFKKWMSFNTNLSPVSVPRLKALFACNTDEPFELEEDNWYGLDSKAGHRGWLPVWVDGRSTVAKRACI
jgi:hypothetical protein